MPAIPAIIAGVAGVVGAKIAAGGNTSAAQTNAAASDTSAQIQADTAAKALAQAKDIYNQQRADEGPYRQSGYGAMNALNFGLGLPQQEYQAPQASAPAATSLPSSTINGLTFPGAPQVPTGTLATVGQVASQGGPIGGVAGKVQSNLNNAQQIVNAKYAGTGATTRVQAPNGLVYLVPGDKVAEAQANGGKVL